MIEELPDIEGFISVIADIHRKSAGRSPNGKYGFHIETGLPFVAQDNTYQSTWEEVYTQMIGRVFVEEEKVHGKDDELEILKHGLFERVIPRLLRPLNKTIKPCLIHTNLWPGNIHPDVDTDQIMIFDSRGMWGHNECDLGKLSLSSFRPTTITFLSGRQIQTELIDYQGHSVHHVTSLDVHTSKSINSLSAFLNLLMISKIGTYSTRCELVNSFLKNACTNSLSTADMRSCGLLFSIRSSDFADRMHWEHMPGR